MPNSVEFLKDFDFEITHENPSEIFEDIVNTTFLHGAMRAADFDDIMAHLSKATYYMWSEGQDFKKALRNGANAAKIDPQNTYVLFVHAMISYEKGDFMSALICLHACEKNCEDWQDQVKIQDMMDRIRQEKNGEYVKNADSPEYHSSIMGMTGASSASASDYEKTPVEDAGEDDTVLQEKWCYCF